MLSFVFCFIYFFFFVAPFIANFYADEQFTILVRVLGLTLVISGVKNVLQAYVAKNMIFKKFFCNTFWYHSFSNSWSLSCIQKFWCLGFNCSATYKFNNRYICALDYCSLETCFCIFF